MKILIPLFVLALWMAQGTATEWFKKYSLVPETSEQLVSCGATEALADDPRGGFLIVGLYPTGLLRIDASGNKLWGKVYPLRGAKCAVASNDGGFLIGGNFGLSKIDKDGNPAWGVDSVGAPFVRNPSMPTSWIKKLGDKTYLCGYGLGPFGIRIVREKDSAATSDSLPIATGYMALPTRDSGVITCGDGDGGIFLSKINANRKPDSAFGARGTSVIPGYYKAFSFDSSSDGGFIIACQDSGGGSIVLVKTDGKGKKVSANWNGRFSNLTASGFRPQMAISWHVKTLGSGECLLAGIYRKDIDDVSDFFILKADAVGRELWSKRFDHPGDDGFY